MFVLLDALPETAHRVKRLTAGTHALSGRSKFFSNGRAFSGITSCAGGVRKQLVPNLGFRALESIIGHGSAEPSRVSASLERQRLLPHGVDH